MSGNMNPTKHQHIAVLTIFFLCLGIMAAPLPLMDRMFGAIPLLFWFPGYWVRRVYDPAWQHNEKILGIVLLSISMNMIGVFAAEKILPRVELGSIVIITTMVNLAAMLLGYDHRSARSAFARLTKSIKKVNIPPNNNPNTEESNKFL